MNVSRPVRNKLILVDDAIFTKNNVGGFQTERDGTAYFGNFTVELDVLIGNAVNANRLR